MLSYIFNCCLFQNLTLAMKTVCEILTTDLEGGPARIPFSLFKELYTYLAEIDGEIAKEHVDTVIEHLSYDVWVVHFKPHNQKLATNKHQKKFSECLNFSSWKGKSTCSTKSFAMDNRTNVVSQRFTILNSYTFWRGIHCHCFTSVQPHECTDQTVICMCLLKPSHNQATDLCR